MNIPSSTPVYLLLPFACFANELPNLAQVLHSLHAARPAFDLCYSPTRTIQSSNVDISLLLKPSHEDENRSSASSASISRSASIPSSVTNSVATSTALAAGRPTVPAKRSAPPLDLSVQSPAKKQSKWSSDEDARIIQLRGDGMKWEDISKHLPGRSAISCRLHYQNYLERRSEWDEDRKNKLARLYERFKADMWSRIAEEMAIPWRAAEAMHWQMGETEMARRAGVTPFMLANNALLHPGGAAPPRPHGRYESVTPRMRRNSGPSVMPPQLPSLAELTAGVPAFAAQGFGSQPSTPYNEYAARRSLPPQPFYEARPHQSNLPNQPNER